MLKTYQLWTVAGEAISKFEFEIWNHGKTLPLVGRIKVRKVRYNMSLRLPT